MAAIVDRAADLYQNFEDMIPALSGIFLGIEESNPGTINHARFANACVAVGRDTEDLEKAGCPELIELGTFGDEGFHQDFQDGKSQPFHFWAYFATAANTWGMGRPGGYPAGQITGDVANILHEIIFPDGNGATWQDYALSRAGMNLGGLVNLGVIPPNQLGNFMRYYLGTDGPGAFYVGPLINIVPLQGNQ